MASSGLVCLLVTVLVFGEGCGGDDVALPPETKIVDGEPVDIKNFPYQVFLHISSSWCGGVIISDRWVLTAAHCIIGRDSSLIQIRAGTNDSGSGGVVYDVEQVVHHPEYLRNRQYDISALKASKVIQFNKALGVDKVLLPELGAAPPSEATKMNVTGWGSVSENVSYPDKLKGAVITLVNFANCSSPCYPRYVNLTLCFLPVTGGGCYGDSGGPVTRNNVLIGLVSAGDRPCGKNKSFVASVFAFRKWIQDVTKV